MTMKDNVLSKYVYSGLLAIFVNNVHSAESKVIKCHLLLAGKQEVVHQFDGRKPGINIKKLEQSLAGQTIFAADGKTKILINDVVQCVYATQPFTQQRSRNLESKSLF